MAELLVKYDETSTLTGTSNITNVSNTGTWVTAGDLSVAASASGPTITTVNGKRALKFTQNSGFQRLVSTGLGAGLYQLNGQKTYFVVSQYDITGTNRGRVFSSTYTAETNNILIGHWQQKSCIGYASTAASPLLNGVEAGAQCGLGTTLQTNLYVYCLTQDFNASPAPIANMYVNGIFKGQKNVNVSLPLNFSIGGGGAGNFNTEMSDCIFCEARVYNGVLSGAEITSITNTLISKWDASTTLPLPAVLTPNGTVTIASRVYDSTITINASQIASTLSLVGATGVDPTKPVTITSLSASYPSPSAGLKTVTVTGTLSDTANYTLAALVPVNTTITAAPLTAATTVNNKVYDGTISATTGPVTLTGIIGSEAVTGSAIASFGTANVGPGISVAINYSIGGTAAGNYSLSNPSGSGTAIITSKALTVSDITANNKVFDTTITATTTGTPILTGVVSGETVTAAVSSANFNTPDIENNKPVTVAFTLNGPTSSNYTLANITLYADITAVPSPSQAQQYLVSSTTDTSASGVTSCVGTTSMRQSKAQGTFKPATSQDWIRYKKGLCSR